MKIEPQTAPLALSVVSAPNTTVCPKHASATDWQMSSKASEAWQARQHANGAQLGRSVHRHSKSSDQRAHARALELDRLR